MEVLFKKGFGWVGFAGSAVGLVEGFLLTLFDEVPKRLREASSFFEMLKVCLRGSFSAFLSVFLFLEFCPLLGIFEGFSKLIGDIEEFSLFSSLTANLLWCLLTRNVVLLAGVTGWIAVSALRLSLDPLLLIFWLRVSFLVY